MDLKKTSCEVGMHFGIFRDNSVKIENNKTLRIPFGKREAHFTSGRHENDR